MGFGVRADAAQFRCSKIGHREHSGRHIHFAPFSFGIHGLAGPRFGGIGNGEYKNGQFGKNQHYCTFPSPGGMGWMGGGGLQIRSASGNSPYVILSPLYFLRGKNMARRKSKVCFYIFTDCVLGRRMINEMLKRHYLQFYRTSVCGWRRDFTRLNFRYW